MAIVYWIRKPEHSDMFKEGYIGVSSRTLEDRVAEHVKVAGENHKKVYAIHQAIRSIGIDNLIHSTILVAEEDYCYEVEAKLRPERGIGWNIAEGGSKPPSKKGFTHSEESKEKISKVWKGKKRSAESVAKSVESRKDFKHSEETIEKLRELSTGRKQSPETVEKRVSHLRGRDYSKEHRNKISEARLSKNPWEIYPAKTETWEKADIYYEVWLDLKSPYVAAKKLELTPKSLVAMWKRFENGYIPLENESWLETFRPKSTGGFDAH